MLFNFELSTGNSYKALGRLIKFYRSRIGYSLRDLGELTNVSHTLIANIEQGKVKGSDETIKDLMKALNVTFNDCSEIINEFVDTYNLAFDYLYKYEYTRANIEMEKLLENEFIYMHSVLITDYALIKFLHKALMGQEPRDQYIDLRVIKGTYKNLSDNQKQMYLLIEGISKYNEGLYSESIDFLNQAIKVGQSNLDYLAKVFMVKNYVKTYSFMDVVKVGNEIIDFFEDKIIYLRAMEVRLSISYSLMINRQYDDAKNLLDSVYHFANNFNAVYLIEEAKLLQGTLCILNKKIPEAKEILYSLNLRTPIVYFLKIRIAIRENNDDEVLRLYNEFLEECTPRLEKEELVLQITLREVGLLTMTEDEYIKKVRRIISIGEAAADIEVINSCYIFLIRYYKNKRMYKKAFEASMKAREIMQFGCLK